MASSSKKHQKLFSDFPPIPTELWEEQIMKDLKGADFEKRLMWNTREGFKAKPFYRDEDIKGLPFTDSLPGEFPFVRGTKATNNRWEIRQDIRLNDIPVANKIAVEAIARGAEGIGFNATEVYCAGDIYEMFKNIELNKTAIHFIASREYPFLLEQLIALAKKRGVDPEDLKGTIGFDPFSFRLLYGDYFNSLDDNLDEASYLILKLRTQAPGFKVIQVRGDFFHNAGGTIVQELAYSLASGNEYLSRLTERGLDIDKIAQSMHFTFSLGSNYFLEIAKIRAARMLWAAIVRQYNPKESASEAMYIHGTTSIWNKSIYDPWVNILRNTTETMAGAIAGCDMISVSPFDITYKSTNDFSDRISRNTQIILKEESYFDAVADPAAGSYYIENLTWSLAKAAWEEFCKIEAEGGFLTYLEDGKIKSALEESASRKEMDIAKRATVMVGTNNYPDLSGDMLDKVETLYKKDYPELRLFRGADGFEQLRLATEKHIANGNSRPAVFLLTFGNLSMLKARAAFSTNFFGCGGFDIIDNPGFATPAEGVKAAFESKAQIIVLCSSDEEYATFGAEAASSIKKENRDKIVVVAGNPTEIIAQLNKAGIDDYIHVRTNILESLVNFSNKLGIV